MITRRRSSSHRLAVQLELPRPKTHGGKRKGAGRPRTRPGPPGVQHRPRPALASRHPVHVTLRARPGAPRLRTRPSADALRSALRAGCEKPTFRLVHFSIQPNHVHLICEADGTVALTRGVMGLEIRMARALNRAHGRRGSVWADRYHARILESPSQTRHCLVYVLGNFRHHGGERTSPMCIDALSSAYWFSGYRERDEIPKPPDGPPLVAEARTWLLSEGWQLAGGLISVAEGPRA